MTEQEKRELKEQKEVQEKTVRTEFERRFGVNKVTRTKQQWSNLVKVYGIAEVCKQDGMTEDEVNRICNETFAEKIERQKREQMKFSR